MSYRQQEEVLLSRCALVALGSESTARDQREANVFELAGMVLQSRLKTESVLLRQASEQFFASNPDARMETVDVLKKGWIISLPRLRDMLTMKLRLSQHD